MKKPILFWSLFLLSILIIMLFGIHINHVTVYQLENFDVKKDGFNFPNYTNFISNDPTQKPEEKVANLTAAEMQRLFKSENICSNAEEVKKGNKCILIPQAKEWMERVNNGMSEGHCEGMAVLSLALYEGRLNRKCQDNKDCLEASKLWQGAKTAYDLPFNSPIQREIAYWYATQFTFPTRVIEDEPNTYEDLVTQLKKTMRSQQSSPPPESKQSEKLYTMAVYWKEGSHLITPYKIEEKGLLPGFKKYVIWVYDNSHPAEEIKLKIDHPREKAQPIVFSTSSTRGKTSKVRGSVIADGDKITSMRLIKNIYREKEQSTLFTLANNQIWTQGGANLNILSLDNQDFKQTDSLEPPDETIKTYHCPQEKHPCYVQQEFLDGKQNDVSSVYHIPVGVSFKLEVSTNSEKNKDKPKAIKMIGPYYYFEVENMKINYKDKNILAEFIPERNILTFENNTDQKQDTLTISGGFPIDQGPDYELVQIKKVSVGIGNKLEITRSWQKKPDWYKQFISLKVSKAGSNKKAVTLKQFIIKRRKGDGLDTFSVAGSNKTPEISLGKDEQFSFSFGLMPSDLVPPFGLMPSNVVCRFPLQRRDKDGKIVDSLLLTNMDKDCKDLPKYSLFDEAKKVAEPAMRGIDSTPKSPGELNQFIRHWQQAIGLMQLVPQTDSDYEAAQANIRAYKEYLRDDVERLQEKVLSGKTSDFFWGTASYWDTVTRYWYWETQDKSGSNTVAAKERYQETLNFALGQLTQLSKQMPESSQSEEARQDLAQANIKIQEYMTAINDFKQAENNYGSSTLMLWLVPSFSKMQSTFLGRFRACCGGA